MLRAQREGHKQTFCWMGPRRVIEIFVGLVYDVRNLISHAVERVHTSRLMQYRADMDGKCASPELLKHIANSAAHYELVDALVDITGNKKVGIFMQVMCEIFPERSDWTCHKLKELHEDVPDKVNHFCQMNLIFNNIFDKCPFLSIRFPLMRDSIKTA